MSEGSITLGDVAERAAALTVACSRCDRAGRYKVETLIARHGPLLGVPLLLRLLSEDSPKRAAVSAYDLCGIHCPELPALFLGPSRVRRIITPSAAQIALPPGRGGK